MQAPHAIQTLRFELLADAVPQARRLPERFSALCRQQLAVVLEEEFAAHCPPHQQLRLPQLVLELPPIADRHLEAELPDLLRRALRAALSQLSASEQTAITTTPEAASWLDVLEHFLRHGRLPWQVAAGSFSLDEVLRGVVEHQASSFRALLVRLGQTARQRQRLVWQLNADQLQLLLVVLEPIHAPFLHAYLLATLAAHRRQPLTPITATALRGIVYELVLADLLLHAGTSFNRRAFLERQVRQLAGQYNLSFMELLRQLVAAKPALAPRTQSALSVLLEDLHQRYRPADAPGGADEAGRPPSTIHGGNTAGSLIAEHPHRRPAGTADAAPQLAASAAAPGATDGFSTNPAAALSYYLQHGSLPLTAPALTPQQLLVTLPAWLAQGWRVLRPELRAGGLAALHRLTHLLPEPMLMQVLRLAAPGQVRPVQGVLDAVWQQPTRAAGNTRQNMWAHTFSYLLREDFRSFSSPVFQQWLARQIVATAVAPLAEAPPNASFSKATSAASNSPNALFAGSAPAGSAALAASPDAVAAGAADLANDAPGAGHVRFSIPTLASTSNAAFTDNALSAENVSDPNRTHSAGKALATGNAPFVGSDAAANKSPVTGAAPAAGALASVSGTSASETFAQSSSSAASNAPAAGNALSLLQAQQVIQYHLAEGTVPPWWPGSAASPVRLRALLAQVLRARPLPDFLRTRPLPTEAQQRLAELADFAQLAVLLTARRLPGGTPPPPGAALAVLERREVMGAAGYASGWLLLLRAAYLSFYLNGSQATAAAGSELAEIRRLAATYQLPVSTTLGKIRRLLSAQPTLLADAFFTSLNQLLPAPVAPNTHPAAANTHPAAAQPFPAAANTFPATANTYPATSQPFPATANTYPATINTSPATAQPYPATINTFPAASQPFPAATNTYPATINTSPAPTKPFPATENPFRAEQNPFQLKDNASRLTEATPPTTENVSPEAENAFGAIEQAYQAPKRLTQLPTGVAARDLVFYLLRYQRLPWWAPANLNPAQQRLLLTRVANEYRAGLQALVQAHGSEPAFRQALAELASFAQLARFVSRPGRPAPGRLAPTVLAALDQKLVRAGEPVARLLRQAYLTAAFLPNAADIRTLAAEVRAQTTRAGTAWRTVLRYVAWLHRQLPALAAAPFFAALLAAAAYEQVVGPPPRRASQRSRVQPRSNSGNTVQNQLAATALQALEEYLRTGQAPAFATGENAGEMAAGSLSANGAFATRASVNENAVDGNTASHGLTTSPGAAASAVARQLAAQWKLLLRPEHRPALHPLKPLLASRTVRTRLLASLAEAGFWLLLRQLYPSHYRLAFRIAADWQLLARQGLVRLGAPALFEVLLALIQATPVASWRPEAAVRALLAAEEALWPQAPTKREHSRAGHLLAAIGRRGLVLRGPLGALLLLLHQQAGQVAKPAPPAPSIPFIKEEDRPLETVYLTNAGLVLLWPFLTMLFDRLGYLESQQFCDEGSRHRAALLLQFLASGTSEVPEYQLPLNKLLCGMGQGQPLPRELGLTAAETELGESLLRAVIARWDALKNTSIAGLRETFLLRPGKLDWLPDDRIVLTVEPKTLDILLDRRPWSISIIKLPWMAAPLYVTWR